MAALLVFVARRIPLVFGLLGVQVAVDRWLWFQTLPRTADARICGNCFLGIVGVPIELALLGLLLAAESLLEIPFRGNVLFYWCCAVAGVVLTPLMIGFPFFVFAFLALIVSITRTVFETVARVALRW